ncbi:MAG: bifunctional 5,10-methylenetetrahydrofolate dehydrogenase/5,10-methenyltetrahydrofolate cyclohydrolase [Muribaculaceae bacterium]|nr:bifunctional 5,10-methylenetetrahydrofolate dehydrogenase/5,10-methenyltetrahydrofolate cyclohydrolase [Muribaculaceae bacterium]
MAHKPIILDGKKVSAEICEDLKSRVSILKEHGYHPTLCVVVNPNDKAGEIYVRQKEKRAAEIGIELVRITAREFIKSTTPDPIIVQLPAENQETADHLVEYCMSPFNDVDGIMRDECIASLATGAEAFNAPCTPAGIITLLSRYGINPDAKMVTVIGRSNIVGRPLARMLEHRGATVALCHSHTPREKLMRLVGMSDIVVSATGKPNTLTLHDAMMWMWNVGRKVFVDVGITRKADGHICGDLDPNLVAESLAYTPVPGGVGPMTVITLMEHVVAHYEGYLRNEKEHNYIMRHLSSIYTHRVKDTGEIIEEMEYTGLNDVDAVKQFTGCAPHDLYMLGPERDNVGGMINVPKGDGDDFDSVKFQPGNHIIKRGDGTIEVWSKHHTMIPTDKLELVSKRIIIT